MWRNDGGLLRIIRERTSRSRALFSTRELPMPPFEPVVDGSCGPHWARIGHTRMKNDHEEPAIFAIESFL
jgi:hypothetical protein